MTTPAAEAQYASEHLQQWGGKPAAVFNPHNRPVEKLPTIYGFNNGGKPGYRMEAVLITQDGCAIGSHCCSFEHHMPHDLGIVEGSRPDRHETFRKHYPDGYRMEFVAHGEVDGHAGLQAALAEFNNKQTDVK